MMRAYWNWWLDLPDWVWFTIWALAGAGLIVWAVGQIRARHKR